MDFFEALKSSDFHDTCLINASQESDQLKFSFEAEDDDEQQHTVALDFLGVRALTQADQPLTSLTTGGEWGSVLSFEFDASHADLVVTWRTTPQEKSETYAYKFSYDSYNADVKKVDRSGGVEHGGIRLA